MMSPGTAKSKAMTAVRVIMVTTVIQAMMLKVCQLSNAPVWLPFHNNSGWFGKESLHSLYSAGLL